MRAGITITLARDVYDASQVPAVQADLISDLEHLVDEMVTGSGGSLAIEDAPAPWKNSTNGGEYRVMRDGENEPQYTEVRVRAYLADAVPTGD